ncbi:MAG: PAS domain S-box protein [Desulfobacterales bacterium]|nr:PAS domain S-box protein [Desulfobacterales bacterium]
MPSAPEDRYTKKELLAELKKIRRQLAECRHQPRNEQEKYQRFLEASPDPVIFVNASGNIAFANSRLEQLFGYGPEELNGRDLDILIPPSDRWRHRRLLADYFKNSRLRSMGSGVEATVLRKDGTVFPADISLNILETGNTALVAGAIRDITRRKQNEAKIERNYHIQRVISAVLKISLEPLTLREKLGKMLEQIVSVQRFFLEKKGVISLLDPDNREPDLQIRHGFSDQEEIPCHRVPPGNCHCGGAADGGRIIFSAADANGDEKDRCCPGSAGHYCVPVVAGDQRPLGMLNVFVRDGHRRGAEEERFLAAVADTLAAVIERHRSEREKQLLRQQLVQAEKLAALGRITANMAHEIRNPLTTVGGLARRLDKAIPASGRAREYTEVIINEVERLERILYEVLSFSDTSLPACRELEITALLDEVLAGFISAGRTRGVEIVRAFQVAPRMSVDATRLGEALEHLIANGLEAMPAGGRLEVITGQVLDQKRAWLAIRVRDNGEGIPAASLPLIFEPFYSTRRPGAATGLGLSVARKIAEDHGGRLEVESEPGRGSMFSMLLPLEPLPAAPGDGR